MVRLDAPTYVMQTINNCGPASLAMYLDYYGWEGTQDDISALIKPVPEDRNVNVEELVYYVRTRAGWLNAEFRVGGTINLLKQFIAAGIPVMIEESFHFQEAFWPNDDLWAAHYLLLTGYDDTRQVFTTQDSFYGPNQAVEYRTVDKEWQIFNRVYIVVYPPSRQADVEKIIEADWDVDANRQRALETSRLEAQTDASNAYAWFNLGSNQVYFGRYQEAAQAYDQARTLGLPQRMLRYQFGPFFAYFHAERIDDLLALTEYALQRTPNAEEALLWHGWALYRKGDTNQAAQEFRKALEANPYSLDASYALDFIGAAP
jgi:tetratricopeptide (TPR) repeat protein